MALLGSLIDVRTIDTLAAAGTVSFAHGLPASPDYVLVIGNATRSTNVSAFAWIPTWDATNVTVQNCGEGASATARVIATVAHSIVR
jgi:hypothetical protein